MPFLSVLKTKRFYLEDIEAYTGKEIDRYDIHPEEYKDIIEESDFNERDWKKLLDENSDSDSWQE